MIFPCERCGWMFADCTCRLAVTTVRRQPERPKRGPRPGNKGPRLPLSPELAKFLTVRAAMSKVA